MKRTIYVDSIISALHAFEGSIESGTKINLLNNNVHSENFVRDLLNLLYGWNLTNVNEQQRNSPGVDLAFFGDKILVQVTSSLTKQKIDSSLNKIDSAKYGGFRFKVFHLIGSAEELRKKTYINQPGILFTPSDDIIDIDSIIKDVNSLDIDKMKSVYDLVCAEIPGFGLPIISTSDLAFIVKKLAKAPNGMATNPQRIPNPYDIADKIRFNDLEEYNRLINEYKIYVGRLNDIYRECTELGNPVEIFILQNLSDLYSRYRTSYEGIALFDKIVEGAVQMARSDSYANDISIEAMNLGVRAVVVDAFMRCKIFEAPKGYSHVDA